MYAIRQLLSLNFFFLISDQHEAGGGDVARDGEADHRGQVHDGGLPNQGRHG